MSEHRNVIKISESCVDLNLLKVERQDPDNFTCFQTQEKCAWEIAAYVFNTVFLSLKIDFVLANSADPDEMPHYASFHLCLHCLSKYPFRGFWFTVKTFG